MWRRVAVLIVLAFAVICEGHVQRCWSRKNDKNDYTDTLRMTRCSNPREAVVALEIPEGFDNIYPRVVIAKRCTGLQCLKMDFVCSPTAISNRTMRVEVYKNGDAMNRQCRDVKVNEHLGCSCRCLKTQADCNDKMFLNKDKCICECDKDDEKSCIIRMDEEPGKVMWDDNHCTCVCNNRRQCGSGEKWSNDNCSCVLDNAV